MLIPVQKFFSSLAEKCCNRCGQSIQEQADCYQTICNACGDAYFYSLNSKESRREGVPDISMPRL